MYMLRATRLISAIAISGVIALGPALGAQAADDPTPPPTPTPAPTLVSETPTDGKVDDICDAATLLIEAGKSQQALDLIEKLRAPGSGGGDKYLDNIRFKCEPERIAALEALGDVGPDPTAAEAFGKQWDSFVKTWVTPLATSLAATLGFFVGLVVLGRMAALIPRLGRGIHTYDRRALRILSVLIMAASSIAFVTAFRGFGTEGNEQPPWALLAFIGAFAIVGSFLFGVVLAGRLKLALDAQKDGVDSLGTKSKIIDLLYRFAAAPPKGVELPSGGDLGVLASGALPSALSGSVWLHIQDVIKFVFLGTPWRIKVDSDELTYATVNIQHNGAALPKTEFTIASLKLPSGVDPAIALRVFSAAVVIVTLSKYHSGFQGLLGVQSYQSLGNLYLSTLVTDDAAKAELRRSAFAIDQRNRPALLATLHAQAREATAAPVLEAWVAWLTNELGQEPPWWKRVLNTVTRNRPLDYELRTRYLLVIAQANLRQVKLPANPTPAQWQEYDTERGNALGDVTKLATYLQWNGALDGGGLRDQLRTDTAMLFAEAVNEGVGTQLPWPDNIEHSRWTDQLADPRWTKDLKRWYGEAFKSKRPRDAYNAACHLTKMNRRAQGPEQGTGTT